VETTFRQQGVRLFLTRHTYVPLLCLIATFPSACSFDASKLRAPSSNALDGAFDGLANSDAVDDAAGGTAGQADVGSDTYDVGHDVAVAGRPDLATTAEVAVIVDVAVADDLAAAGDVSGSDGVSVAADRATAHDVDFLDDVPTSLDLATGEEVADAPHTDDVTDAGGIGGGGTGGGGIGSGGTDGASMDGGAGGSGPDPDLVLWYKFDESTGTTAADSALWGGTARNATLTTIGVGGTAAFTTVKQVGTHAVILTPSTVSPNANGGYVTVPSAQALAPTAITLAVWVNLATNTAAQNWERIFDFGTSTMTYMYLTARASDAPNTPVRFAITTKGNAATAEQRLDGTSMLSESVWHHIAVVLPAGPTYTGTLYIDGVAVATNSTMTLHASNLGVTTNNWLGRSQFGGTSGSNPCFNGLLDEFRVYRRALSQQEIAVLFALR
jgi:hypothetical protein